MGIESPFSAPRPVSGFVTTDDGVRLHYLEAGEGPDMLLVPGWSQTAAQWRHQIADFSRTHHVVAVDHRGHGGSERPEYGYRVARLAADAHQVIGRLGLDRVVWVGHSMGCAVAWAYWDLFGGDRVASLVLADQPPVLVRRPQWPQDLAARLGAVFEADQLFRLAAEFHDPARDARAVTGALLAPMWSAAAGEADRAWVTEQNLLLPRGHAATLMLDHAMQDWRDVLPRITVPTLVVGGQVSVFPASASRALAAAIPGAAARILGERGSHFAFWEDPAGFDEAIRDFLGGPPFP